MTPSEPTPSADGISAIHKAVAGVFVTVLAPVLVAFGIKFSDTLLTAKPEAEKAATATPAAAPAATPPAAPPSVMPLPPAPPLAPPPLPVSAIPLPAAPGPLVPAATPSIVAVQAVPTTVAPPTPASTVPVTTIAVSSAIPTNAPSVVGTGSSTSSNSNPAKAEIATAKADGLHFPHFKRPSTPVIKLFNGRDLNGFYTLLGPPQPKAKPYGKDHDPERVFSVNGGLLIVSGETLGVLETVKEYSDYWLTLEYKWGERTWPPREEGARHSAVLLNIDGPDGVVRNIFPVSLNCQICEGGTGDFLLAGGQGEQSLSLLAATEDRTLGRGPKAHRAFFYKPGQPQSTFSEGFIKRYPAVENWQDVKGYRAANDVEHPHGEWNTLDIVALDGKIMIQLNDHVVNFGLEASPAKGRIGIQSNGAEIIFRTINLQHYHRGKKQQEKK